MKNFGFAGIAGFATAGFAAAFVGMAAPAQAEINVGPAGLSSVEVPAGIDHHHWIHDIQPTVQMPPAPIIGNGR